jgi:ERCC4-related helicase
MKESDWAQLEYAKGNNQAVRLIFTNCKDNAEGMVRKIDRESGTVGIFYGVIAEYHAIGISSVEIVETVHLVIENRKFRTKLIEIAKKASIED